jgi:transposase-like protein
VQHDSALVTIEGGSGDELCFDDYMAQQEFGARSRHRQSLVNLHYNINHELQQERESGQQSRLRGRSERCRRLEGGLPGKQRSMEGDGLSRGREEGNIEGNPISKQTLKKNGNWTTATLQQAMHTITDHGMKVRTASRSFGIPATTLRNHLYGRSLSRQRGQQSVLKEDEEKKLVQYLFKMQDLGHRLIAGQLRLKVALATQTRDTPWSAVGIPGKS